MSTTWPTDATGLLPDDGYAGTLAGRAWLPDTDGRDSHSGPVVVAIRADGVVDVSSSFATMHALTEQADPAAALAAASGPVIGTLDELAANTPPENRDRSLPWLLSPIDLHVVKAAGVTFPVSMIERVIEERARGDQDAAAVIRSEILETIGGSLDALRPGSEEASALKALLLERGWWSQYLEVGIGPDAEVFTKAPVLSTVGPLVDVGVHPASQWNNPEPEIVLVVSSDARIVGASLGNDVNLRDIEGRSALLLGKAKDNNASASVGPFIRLFDSSYDLDALRASVVRLSIDGEDGYRLDGHSELARISRDPADLVDQVVGAHHQYPDGFVLYLGTMFAPVDDRDVAGRGFTHHDGDLVRIAEPRLGALVNRVRSSTEAAPWTFGIDALYRSLTARGLLR
ncbi:MULTISPECIES: fumarylacetoacetate hydrolase family protein [unclassified Leifsonia]|uniref:fumarylacetoacetate hydrolase family protein n=1 Tax=unclassified Leifsonia TaxID=2663824 RepID=UPI0006F5658F|nr:MULTISPECIES: fumarylacetoacetate hydrolase family protein [unclassified Leifsonia]KQX05780.1 fumarylacetoacetate hydrolase [Leifsonia sp. Root1293]KRA09415.1 fumarylacetoacetate hydrolase [Leifsonia sp. Root60]